MSSMMVAPWRDSHCFRVNSRTGSIIYRRAKKNLPPSACQRGRSKRTFRASRLRIVAPMSPSVFSSWDQLADLDVARDLDGRVLQVTLEGLSWHPCVSPDLTPERLVE